MKLKPTLGHLLSFILGLGFCQVAWSEEVSSQEPESQVSEFFSSEYKRRWSLDTGYAFSAISNRSVSDFYLESVQGVSALYDFFQPDHRLARLALFSGFFKLLSDGPFFFASHEFGHASRYLAADADPEMFYNNGRSGEVRSSHFFTYFFKGFGEYSGSRGLTLPSHPVDEEMEAIADMGGFNVDMSIAEKVGRNIQQNGGHLLYAPAYFAGKLSSWRYMVTDSALDRGLKGDVREILNYYRSQRSYDFGSDEIKVNNWVALFGSASTYAFLKQAWAHLFGHGDAYFEALTFSGSWKSFLPPETHFYYTTRGLSLKIDSGYRIDESLMLRFGLEQVTHGHNDTEVNLGFDKRLTDRLSLSLLSYWRGKHSLESAIIYELSGRHRLSGGWNHFNKRTLFGERHSTDLTHNHADELWFKWSMLY